MPRTVLSRSVTLAVAGCALLALAATPACAETPAPSPPSERASEPPTAAAPPSGDPGSDRCPETAAAKYGWGRPTMQSDFAGTSLPPDWHAYGPEPGHQKKGTRSPDAVTVADGVVTITGDADGNTGAISWHPGQRYGRWEACVRSDAGEGGYHPVFLLWPVAEDWPVGGEVDWMEIMSGDRQETSFFLHYGENNDQDHGSLRHDATRWTAYALEWTPERMTAYVDGREWYSNTETDHFPPAPMNMTMQLDYFPPVHGGSAMQMDWAKQWALPESEPAQLSLGPGDPATGQPDEFPDRKPRPLDRIPATG